MAKDLADKQYLDRVITYAKRGLLGFVALYVITFAFVVLSGISIVVVSGHSMLPTFKHNEILFLKSSTVLEKDNIIVFRKPQPWGIDEDRAIIKRIAAVPGDKLDIDKGVFKVNDKVVFDAGEAGYRCTNTEPVVGHILGDKEVMVLGDNYTVSLDSRKLYCDGVREFLVNTGHIITQGKVKWTI